MSDPARDVLEGRRLLVVEDEYVVAADLADWLADLGVEVIGPAGSVADALDLIDRQHLPLDGAVLDINLGGGQVFPVADRLLANGVPFLFVTGYDCPAVPDAYKQVPRHEKPFDRAMLTRLLSARVGGGPVIGAPSRD